MPNELTGVLSGTSSIIRTQPLTATENGTYNPPSGIDGYKPVTVNVPQPQPVIEQLTALYNGVYNAPSGVDGYDPVVVNVPAPAPVLDDITITENGHYVPPTGVDGYDDITVNVPAPAPVLDDITITENGHYTPPTGVDGYDDITVNVPLPANAYLKQTLSGLPSTIATFTGADAPIDSLKASIEGVQSGSGDPSPSNVRPISGWTGCEVTKWNKNYYHKTKDGRTNNGVTYVTSGSTITASNNATGTSYAFNNNEWTYNNSILLTAGTYTVSMNQITGSAFSVIKVSESGGADSYIVSYTTDTSATFTLSEDTHIAINVRISNGSATDTTFNIQIEKGDQATTYEPYNGNTYTIPFKDSSDNPITVYGGGIDITGGSAEFDKPIIDLGDLTWSRRITAASEKYRFVAIISNSSIADEEHRTSICSKYALLPQGETYINKTGYTITANNEIIIYDENLCTLSEIDFKTVMSGVQLAYELATPQTGTFTPIALRSDGVTNISVDCGNITECKYFTQS